MMVRKTVYDQLEGYDEDLYYEDFDFWIRSGRITKYCYTDKILVKKRILKDSLSSSQYKRKSQILKSTYDVCLKAERINETDAERYALVQRVQFEFRKALFSGNIQIAVKFSEILIRNLKSGLKKTFIQTLRVLLKTTR
jgi:hypothetical protein